MDKTTYSHKLLDPRWQKKRLKILERDNWACTCCNSTEHSLQVHHLKYNGNPWDAKDEDLTTLCIHCHYLTEFCKKSKQYTFHGGFVKTYYTRTQKAFVGFFFDIERSEKFIQIFDIEVDGVMSKGSLTHGDTIKINSFING